MKDWKALAQAGRFDIPGQDLDRIVAPLDALEQVFRPLAARLTPDLEPATVYVPEEDTD